MQKKQQNEIVVAFSESSERLENWVKLHALPLWASLGVCSNTGGHVEQLSANGTPDTSVNVRMRVQSRQIFAFSYMKDAGWFDQGEGIANDLWNFCLARRDGIHYSQLMNSNHEVLDSKEDVYDYAFHILANGWLYKVTESEEKLSHAYALAEYIDEAYKSKYGGWVEGNFDYGCRRQNPHMHLFEAFLSLYEISNDSSWLLRSEHIYSLFESVFFSPEYGALLEYFDEDWSVPCDRELVVTEPGHMYEWVWLLIKFQLLSDRDISCIIRDVYNRAESLTPNAGDLICDSVNLISGVRLETKRCWPMTEAIKAHCSMVSLGYEEALAKAQKCIDTLMRCYFKAREPGMYIDHLGKNDEVISSSMPASTMYHIVVAALEASRLRNRLAINNET